MLGRVWFPAATLAVLIFLLVHGLMTLPSSPMKFPLIVGGIGGPLMIWQIVRGVRSNGEEKQEAQPLRTYVSGAGWFLAIFPLVFILGFIVAAPVYVFLAVKLRGESWWLSALLALVMWMFVYGGLYLGLRVPLYDGLIFG